MLIAAMISFCKLHQYVEIFGMISMSMYKHAFLDIKELRPRPKGNTLFKPISRYAGGSRMFN